MLIKILRMKEVVERVGLSRAQIYELMDENSFPKSIKLTARSIGFLESEINEWILEKVKDRDLNIV